MDLITFLLIVLAFAAVAYLIQKAPFVPSDWKPIINWVLLAVLVLWLISLFVPGFGSIKIGR